jgi:hypothetical protein
MGSKSIVVTIAAVCAAAMLAFACSPAVALQIDVETNRQEVPMGRTVQVDVTVTFDDGRPAAGCQTLSYVNGFRWGAHETTNDYGKARLYLPLPNPGTARIQVQAVGGGPMARWIWTPETRDQQNVFLATSLSLDKPPSAAALRANVDDRAEIFLNGQRVGDVSGWKDEAVFREIAALLKPEENILAVKALNGTGPAGFVAQLTTGASDNIAVTTTGPSWKCWETEPAGWPTPDVSTGTAAHSVGAVAGAPAWSHDMAHWPGADRAALFVGFPLPYGADISAAVAVEVTPRTIEVHEDPEHLVGVQWEPWFTPMNAYWQTAQAVPVVGFYDSNNEDVMRQHALWLMDAGVNFIFVDWSNHIWGKKHWDERPPNADQIIDATTHTLKFYARLRKEGLPVPKVVIMPGLSNGPPTTMEALNEQLAWIHEQYNSNPEFDGLWVEYLGKPLVVPLDCGHVAIKPETPPVDDTHFTVRWMGTQLQRTKAEEHGYWSWMDGVLEPIVTYYDGKAEVVTPTPAYFGDGGWLYPQARGRRSGTTYLESFRVALKTKPKFVLLHQWNEYAGQLEGQGYGDKRDIYVDSYSVEFSDDLEPVSLTAPGYRGDKGGWGYYYQNLTQALISVFHQDEPQDTILAVHPSGKAHAVSGDTLKLDWTVVGKEPTGYTVMLDDEVVVKNLQAMEYVVDLSGVEPGMHMVTVIAEGATTRFRLAYTREDEVHTTPMQTKVESRFVLRK